MGVCIQGVGVCPGESASGDIYPEGLPMGVCIRGGLHPGGVCIQGRIPTGMLSCIYLIIAKNRVKQSVKHWSFFHNSRLIR